MAFARARSPGRRRPPPPELPPWRAVALCVAAASTSVTRRSMRGRRAASVETDRPQAPLMGFFKDRPSADETCESTPGCPGLGIATSPARSVLAVPPSFDGFLLTGPCRFVAPCMRPWGSSGFQPTSDTEVPVADRPHGRSTLRSVSLHLERHCVTAPKRVHRRARPPRRWPGRSPKRPDWPRPRGCDPRRSPLLGHPVARMANPMLPWASSTCSLRCSGEPLCRRGGRTSRSWRQARQPSRARPCGRVP